MTLNSVFFTCLSDRRPKKRRAPIIGATCGFDAKIYKIVDGFFDVNPCLIWNKKFFQFSDFCFQLQAHLVDLLEKILPILSATDDVPLTS
ncbi:MAG TPA: hypothetical protein DIU00_07120 [Phycisphaerales bacterium]|nr:hypothetical protein [Phycisphaerales bacterium]